MSACGWEASALLLLQRFSSSLTIPKYDRHIQFEFGGLLPPNSVRLVATKNPHETGRSPLRGRKMRESQRFPWQVFPGFERHLPLPAAMMSYFQFALTHGADLKNGRSPEHHALSATFQKLHADVIVRWDELSARAHACVTFSELQDIDASLSRWQQDVDRLCAADWSEIVRCGLWSRTQQLTSRMQGLAKRVALFPTGPDNTVEVTRIRPAVSRSANPQKSRGGRPPLADADRQKREALLDKWAQCKADGGTRKQFCEDTSCTLKQLDLAVNWASQRRRRGDRS